MGHGGRGAKGLRSARGLAVDFALLTREWPPRRHSELAPLGSSVRLGPPEPAARPGVPHAVPPPPPAAWRAGPAGPTNGGPPAPASRARGGALGPRGPGPRPPALTPPRPPPAPLLRAGGRAGRGCRPSGSSRGCPSPEFPCTSRPPPPPLRLPRPPPPARRALRPLRETPGAAPQPRCREGGPPRHLLLPHLAASPTCRVNLCPLPLWPGSGLWAKPGAFQVLFWVRTGRFHEGFGWTGVGWLRSKPGAPNQDAWARRTVPLAHTQQHPSWAHVPPTPA